MFKALFIIRFKQMYRELVHVGLFRMLFLAVLVVLLALFVWEQLKEQVSGTLTAVGCLFMVASLHIQRVDKRFLKTLSSRAQWLQFAEYMALLLPLFVMSALQGRYDIIIILVAATGAIVQLNLSVRYVTRNNFLIKMLPDHNFELKSAVRRYFYSLIVMYVVGLAVSFWEGTVPIIVFIITAVFLEFYHECEPRHVLEAQELPETTFINRKLWQNLKIFVLLQLPLWIAFLVFHHQYWYVVPLELFFSLLAVTHAIVLKYALYEPNRKLQANTVITAIALMSFFVPFLFPVTIVQTLRYYYKSINNLQQYLHDYHS